MPRQTTSELKALIFDTDLSDAVKFDLPHADIHHYHSGRSQTSTSVPDTHFFTLSPTTTLPLARVFPSSPTDLRSALDSATTAFATWSRTSTAYRAGILLRAAKLLRDRNDELARLETEDTGKPFSETSAVDVISGAEVLEYYARLITSSDAAINPFTPEVIKLRENATITTSKHSLGPCIGIGAWNYPLQIALWKSAPCLAAGNTMVYKPSEVTPLHGIVLAELYTQAGLPPGCFNVVNGGPEVGRGLLEMSGWAKVSFTGQVSTGRKVAEAAGRGLKYVTLELGGKSALIVLEDVGDSEKWLQRAVDTAMMANFYSSGQVCTNGTRVFVPEKIRARFEQKLVETMKNFRFGNVFDPETNFGPLVSEAQQEKVWGYIKHGIEVDKATLLCGGPGFPEQIPASVRRSEGGAKEKAWLGPNGLMKTTRGYEGGYWVKPTIFTDCTDDMLITRAEIFGPVMCILPYTGVSSAIERANNTELGLAAGVVGQDVQEATRVVGEMQAGIRWVNGWGESPAEMAVGGWGDSGLGVENGRGGIGAWLRSRSVLVERGEMGSVFSAVEGTGKEGEGWKSKL